MDEIRYHEIKGFTKEQVDDFIRKKKIPVEYLKARNFEYFIRIHDTRESDEPFVQTFLGDIRDYVKSGG